MTCCIAGGILRVGLDPADITEALMMELCDKVCLP